MSLDVTSATISACNKQGDNCGYAVVRATLTNPAAGATVSATSVPSNLGTWLYNSSNGVYTFVIYATNNTRTTNSVEFTGLGCGLPQTVTVTTN